MRCSNIKPILTLVMLRCRLHYKLRHMFKYIRYFNSHGNIEGYLSIFVVTTSPAHGRICEVPSHLQANWWLQYIYGTDTRRFIFGSLLFQEMACRMLSVKPLSEPMWIFYIIYNISMFPWGPHLLHVHAMPNTINEPLPIGSNPFRNPISVSVSID